MFNDKDRQLQRLQEELLEEEYTAEAEITPEQQEEQWFYDDLQVYNNDQTELDPDDLSDELLEPEEPSLQGPMLTALFLIVGIFLVVCWWILRMRGAI